MPGQNISATTLIAALAVLQLALYSSAEVAAQVEQGNRPARQTEQISSWPPREKRFAVIIGVRDYSDSRISPLIAPNEDAHMLYDALIKFADFPRDNITLLATDRPGAYQPTRPIIIEYLSNLKRLLPPDSLLLVAFSGHGIEVEEQAFLLGADARLNEDLKVLKDTAISWSEVMDYIADSGARQVVMLLDACRNDPRSGKSTPRPNRITQIYSRGLSVNTQKRKVAVYAKLLATSKGEQAWEDAEKGQGFFMGAVVDGLSGAAANDDGKVTLASLITYVKSEVAVRARRKGLTQNPFEEILNYDTGQLIISRTEPKQKQAPAAPTEPGPVFQPDFESRFWTSVENSNDPAEYEIYLKRYPNGIYADLARIRVAKLRKPQAASPPAPAQPEQVKEAPLKREPKPEEKPQTSAKTEADKQAELRRQAQAEKQGQMAEQARLQQAELTYWNSIAKSGNADTFKEYLQKYPAGKFVKEARVRLNELEEEAHWSSIIASPDVEKLKAYLLKYPAGKFAAIASARIAELAEVSFWNTASASGKPEMLKSYLQKYPTGKFAEKAFARLVELEEVEYWNGLSGSSNPEDFKAYLRKYPNGRFAPSASGRINELTESAYWETVGNTPGGPKAYLEKYPDGRYADEARSRMAALVTNKPPATSAETYIKNGKKFADEKRWAEAETEYRRAVALEPKNAALRDSLGWALLSLNKWQEAEAELREAVRLQPDNSEWRGRLGRILITGQKWREAETETREAVRLDPAKAIWHNNLAYALQFQYKLAEAETEYLRAVEMEPNNALFQANLGWCRANQKKWGEAESDLRTVVKLRPNSGEQRGRLGYILLQQQKWAEAEAETREALKLEPNKAVWHSNLAGALLNQQKWGEAEAELREAARLEPNDATWHGLLGGVLFQQKKWADAEAEYSRAAQLDPKNPLYTERLKQSRDYQQKAEPPPPPAPAPKTDAEKTKPAGPDFTAPELLNRVRPLYTEEARNRKIEGRVTMRILVGADGSVKDVKVIEGLPYGLTERATAAAYTLRFKPAKKNGQPVEHWISISMEFELH